MTEHLSINGLKLSDPLIVVRVDEGGQAVGRLTRLCRLLAENEVNLAFMTWAGASLDRQPILCCIDPKDQVAAAQWIDRTDDLRGQVRFGGTVGLITFYPHHSSLKLMGLALELFSRSGIVVHGLASSISALSFVVDFDRLEEAGRLLSDHFELPENVSPPRADFRIRQERRPF